MTANGGLAERRAERKAPMLRLMRRRAAGGNESAVTTLMRMGAYPDLNEWSDEDRASVVADCARMFEAGELEAPAENALAACPQCFGTRVVADTGTWGAHHNKVPCSRCEGTGVAPA